MSKNQLNDLAYFGGTPLYVEPLHVGRPNLGDRQRLMAYLNDILDRRWLTNGGPCVREIERRIEDLLGVKHCIATCNATVALEIASRALGLKGEVIIPSFTFIATAHALQWQAITPVFCDIDPCTHNIDPQQIEALITSRTSGILGVHLWGRACAVEALEHIARKHSLKLLFDAAHAFGCSHAGTMIGNFGAAEVFSFHATKFVNTGEGGAIVTHDDDLAARLRLMTNFGFNAYDSVVHLGINGKMDEFSAALGLTALESLEEFIATNYRHYTTYRRLLPGLPGVRLVEYDERERNNYQYIVIEIDEATTRLSRDLLNTILHAENILARRYFYPGCHRMEPYKSNFPDAGARLPETEKLSLKALQLPTGTAISEEDIQRICELISFVLAHGNQIRTRLEA